MAQRLGIGRATVHTHLRAIYAAFGVKSRARAVIAAIERGYLPENADPVWTHDRKQVLRALRQAWSPCWAHPVYTPDCAVCVRAATLAHAMMLVRTPDAAPSPPRATAGPPVHDPRLPLPAIPGRHPLARPGEPSPVSYTTTRATHRTAS
ncbi:response regulator transcription factor [Streptomyces sp. NPDC004629]|uniref:response regulator transcription factor n=1 Tax=Streptomyces sp. NPDC004629 TaxID=3364705 RepID=UPI00369EC5DC